MEHRAFAQGVALALAEPESVSRMRKGRCPHSTLRRISALRGRAGDFRHSEHTGQALEAVTWLSAQRRLGSESETAQSGPLGRDTRTGPEAVDQAYGKALMPHSEVKAEPLSRVGLSVTPWAVRSVEFSRPEYWGGQPFPSPGHLPHPGMEPRSPALAGRFFTLSRQGSPDNLSALRSPADPGGGPKPLLGLGATPVERVLWEWGQVLAGGGGVLPEV